MKRAVAYPVIVLFVAFMLIFIFRLVGVAMSPNEKNTDPGVKIERGFGEGRDR